MFSSLDKHYMSLALDCARLGIGKVDPNPFVGCLIVKDNQILATGYHHYFGGPHAEVDAISKLKPDQLKGSTLYVTLEPCSHFGKTPPCVDLIIQSQIAKVIIGCVDANPLVHHQGIEKLQNHGIQIEVGLLESECQYLNRKFFYSITHQKPYLTVKYAMSADGKIATKSLDSKWISNPECRQIGQLLRNENMAIMVGINTVLCDNPQLTCRLENKRSPQRIILDTNLDIPLDAFVVQDAINHPTIVLTHSNDNNKIQLLEKQNVQVVFINCVEGNYLDIQECLTKLYDLNIHNILVEGGSELLGSLLMNNCVNELYCFIGNKLIGGKQALTPIGGIGFDKVDQAKQLTLIETKQIDNDIMLHYLVK